MRNFITIILLVLVLPTVTLAGGWNQKKGEGFFSLNQSILRSSSFRDINGNSIPIRTLGTYTTSLYGSYGIIDRLTVIAYIPFFSRNTFNALEGRTTGRELEPGAANNAFGDIDLGFQVGILQNQPFVISVSVYFGIPTGDSKDQLGLLTGDGEFNQYFKVDFGYGFKFGAWINASIGVNQRTKGFSDEFRYDFEAGYIVKERLILAFKLNAVESFLNGNPDASDGTVGLFASDAEYITYGPEIGYVHKDTWGVTYRYTTATKLQNVLAAAQHSVGFFYKLKKKAKVAPVAP